MILHKGDIIRSWFEGDILDIKITETGTDRKYKGILIKVGDGDESNYSVGEEIEESGSDVEIVEIVKRAAPLKLKTLAYKAKNKSKIRNIIKKLI